MKKIVAGTILVLVAVTAGSSAAASSREDEYESEDHASAVKIDDDGGEKKHEGRKIEAEQKKADRQVRKEEQRVENVQKFWNKMEKRLSTLIKNQERLSVRIDKRLDAMQEDGKDVAAAQAKLAQATPLITVAKTALTNGDVKVEAIIAKDDLKGALAEIKVVNKDVLEKIKASHRALVDVLNLMKGPKPSRTPTPTPSPTNS